jgi:hypothetical protein
MIATGRRYEGTKAARHEVWPVVHLGGGPQDLVSGLLADPHLLVLAGQHIPRGGFRHACSLSHLDQSDARFGHAESLSRRTAPGS